MFQYLTNLLGSVTNENQRATAEGVENNSSNTRLTSIETEDNWVLIDQDSEGNSDLSSVDSLDINGDDDDDERQDRVEHNLPFSLFTRTSSVSSLPCMSNMEESWFLTPPPCFTSAGPIHMETSPMENLLIEHPSMSVYQHSHPIRRHNATLSVRTSSPSSIASSQDVELEVEEVDDGSDEDVAIVHRVPRINRLQILQKQKRQGMKSKQAQKLQINNACQTMKRGNLNRNNKAREVNSRNRRQRRGERSQGATRSFANNNRKC